MLAAHGSSRTSGPASPRRVPFSAAAGHGLAEMLREEGDGGAAGRNERGVGTARGTPSRPAHGGYSW